MLAKRHPNKPPSKPLRTQTHSSTIILFSLVILFISFSAYLYIQLQNLNTQILDIDTTTISARTSYFLQAKEGFFMAEALADLNNREDFKKVLYQAPKAIDVRHSVPIKARIWGKVNSITFTLKDGSGKVLGSVTMPGAGQNPPNSPKINTRYLNALYNVEHEENLVLTEQPNTNEGTIQVEENNSLDRLNTISSATHKVEFINLK